MKRIYKILLNTVIAVSFAVPLVSVLSCSLNPFFGVGEKPEEVTTTTLPPATTTTTTTTTTIPDTEPPVLTFVNPVSNQAVSGLVNIVGTVIDVSPIDYVRLAINSTNAGSFFDADVNGRVFSFTTNLTGFAEGTNTIYVYGSDTQGNVSSIISVPILLDREIPTVTLTSPTNGTYYKSPFAVSGSASDFNTIDLVQITLDNVNWDDLPIAQGSTVSFGTNYNVDTLSDGVLTIRVRAFDITGKYGYDAKVITIDKIPPTLTVTSPTNETTIGTTINLAASASDNEGIRYMLVKLDGVQIYSNSASVVSMQYVTNTSFEGPHNVTYECYDYAGNKDEENISIVINENPARISNVTISSAGTMLYLRGTVTVSGTAYDTGSVSNIYYRMFTYPFWTQFATNCDVSTTNFTFTFDTSIYSSGLNYLMLKPLDNLGGFVTFSTNVYIDNTAPGATFINPYAQYEAKGGYLSMSVSITDNLALKEFTLLTNGAVYTNISDILPVGTKTKSIAGFWDLSTFSDGTVNTLVAIVKDRANSLTYVTNHFIVSNNTPTVIIATPASGSAVPRYVHVDGIAFRPDGIKASWIKFSGQSWVTALDTNTIDPTGQTNTFAYTFDALTFNEGDQFITVRAFASNGSYIDQVVLVQLDRTAPTASITAPADNSRKYGTVSLTGTASDAHFSYANVRILTNGATMWGPATLSVSGGSWSTNWDSSTLPVGNIKVILEVGDQAGNKTFKTNSVSIEPYIASVSETSTWTGRAVTITGYNFGTSVNVKLFGATVATNATSTSTAFVIPSGARSGYVGLTVNGVKSMNSNWIDLWTFMSNTVANAQINSRFCLGSDDKPYFVHSSRVNTGATNWMVYQSGANLQRMFLLKSSNPNGEVIAQAASIDMNNGVIAMSYRPSKHTPAGLYVTVVTNTGSSYFLITNKMVNSVSVNASGLTDIRVGSDKRIHLVFSDSASQRLVYAYSDDLGKTWTSNTIVSNMTYDSQLPDAYPSIDLDSSNNPHISYFDYGILHLRHVWRSSGVWYNEVVDSVQYNGQYSDISIDGANGVHISYYNGDQGDLVYNYRSSAGSWSTPGVTLDINGLTGQYTGIATYGSEIAISYYSATYYYGNLAYFKGTGSRLNASDWRIVKIPLYTGMGVNYGRYSGVGFTSAGEIYVGFVDSNNALWVAHYLK